jgi:thioredoxin-like negative regulator of GroEL
MICFQRDRALATARQYAAAGDLRSALGLCQQVLRANPGDTDALHMAGGLLLLAGDHDRAVTALMRALDAGATDPRVLVDLASAHRVAGRHEQAIDCLARAAESDPDSRDVLAARVELLAALGRATEAGMLLEPALRAGRTDARIAAAFAEIAGPLGRESECVELLASHVDDPRLSEPARATMLFRMARLLDRLGRAEDAFRAARRANKASGREFNAAAHSRAIDLLIEKWTSEAISRAPSSALETERPVFIVGLPRSGTSLVEQIIDCHPLAAGADERPEMPLIVERLGGAIARTDTPVHHRIEAITSRALRAEAADFDAMLAAVGGDALRVTDKRPDNFLHLGLISRLFPNARIVHCTRDAMDVGLSCYFHDFYGPYPWANSLEGIGAYVNDYKRLMAHWSRTLDLPIHTVAYEELVEEPQTVIPRLIDFLGLPWDDACLSPEASSRVVRTSSHEQVRKSITTTSVGRWRRYAAHLEPLARALGSGMPDPAEEAAA